MFPSFFLSFLLQCQSQCEEEDDDDVLKHVIVEVFCYNTILRKVRLFFDFIVLACGGHVFLFLLVIMCCLCFWQMKIQKRGRIDASNQQGSVEYIDGMGGAMNEKDMETIMIRKQVQVSVEDVATLIMSRNIEEQVQVGANVRETFATNVSRIEVELQKTIDMIKE